MRLLYQRQSPRGFLSTPSVRRATSDGIARNSSLLISIHALREEGDPDAPAVVEDVVHDFYPRPP